MKGLIGVMGEINARSDHAVSSGLLHFPLHGDLSMIYGNYFLWKDGLVKIRHFGAFTGGKQMLLSAQTPIFRDTQKSSGHGSGQPPLGDPT